MAATAYTHTALFHHTDDELLAELVPFVSEGIEADERVVVVVNAAIGEELRQRIGTSEGYDLLDSVDVYTFPVRTLTAYIETVREANVHGRFIRVAGQPIWNGRSELEIAEWTCVEAACNVVFADARLRMLCPYDMSRLDPAVIAAARRTHPVIQRGANHTSSAEFAPSDHQSGVRAGALTPRPASSEQISVRSWYDVGPALLFVDAFSRIRSIADARLLDLVEAVRVLLEESINDRSGPVTLWLWTTQLDLICDIESRVALASPFVGYVPPSAPNERASLWDAGQRCDLVSIRTHDDRTTVRLLIADYLIHTRSSCGGIDTLLGVYALGACGPEEALAVEAHLATCGACRAELDQLNVVVDLIGDPDDSPPSPS